MFCRVSGPKFFLPSGSLGSWALGLLGLVARYDFASSPSPRARSPEDFSDSFYLGCAAWCHSTRIRTFPPHLNTDRVGVPEAFGSAVQIHSRVYRPTVSTEVIYHSAVAQVLFTQYTR